MDINKLTIGEAREIAQIFCQRDTQSRPVWKIGQAYCVRTVTNYWTGRLVAVTEHELVLEEAAWIADTGRFSNFFTDGPDEAEPIEGPVIIGRGSIVDAQEWRITLPRSQK